MRLEAKKQKAENQLLFFGINCSKQYTRDFSSGWNASSKVRLKHSGVLKHQESYGWCFWRLNDIEKGTKQEFTGSITLSKVKLKYLEVKFKQAKFNWCV